MFDPTIWPEPTTYHPEDRVPTCRRKRKPPNPAARFGPRWVARWEEQALGSGRTSPPSCFLAHRPATFGKSPTRTEPHAPPP